MAVAAILATAAALLPTLEADPATAEDQAPATVDAPSGPPPEVFEPQGVNRTPVGRRPTEPPAGVAVSDGLAEVARGEEVAGLRSEHSKTFRGDDGSFVTDVALEPVHFERGDGTLEEIDSTLVPEAGGLGNAENAFDVWLPESLGEAPVVASDGANSVEFRLRGAAGGDVDAEGATGVYEDVLPEVQAALTATSSGLKELLVLAGPSAVREFTYDVVASAGLSPAVQPDGTVTLTDQAGAVAFTVAAPFMFDSATDRAFSTDVGVAVAPSADGFELRWTLDDAWVDDPARVWPVTVDPTVTVGDAGAQDCWISTRQWYPCNTDPDLRAGAFGDHPVRSLLEFDVAAAIPVPAQVRIAELALYRNQGAAGSAAVSVHEVTGEWSDASVTWSQATGTSAWSSPGGDFDPTPMDVNPAAGGSSGTDVFFLTESVQRWLDESAPNHGVLLKAVDEAGAPDLRWSSEESGAQEQRPKLSIEWTPLVGIEENSTLETFDLGGGRQLQVNVASGNLIIDESDLTIAGTAGYDFEFSRTYNSLLGGEWALGTGWGWTTPASELIHELWVMGDGRNVVYRDPDTHFSVAFIRQPDGSYEPTRRIEATLRHEADESWTLEWHRSGERYRYHPWGYIDRHEDRNGNAIQYYYNQPDYQISSIRDTQGRVTTFERQPSGDKRVTAMIDPAGRRHEYRYDATGSYLQQVTDPSGATVSYSDADDPYAQQTLTDQEGNQTRVTYYDDDFVYPPGRVKSITRITDPTTGTGPTWHFAYTDGITTVTDPRGNDTIYHWDSKGQVSRTVDALGRAHETAYDERGNVLSTTSPLGHAWTSSYESGTDNLLTRTSPTAGTERFAYQDPANPHQPTRHERPHGSVTQFSYIRPTATSAPSMTMTPIPIRTFLSTTSTGRWRVLKTLTLTVHQ